MYDRKKFVRPKMSRMGLFFVVRTDALERLRDKIPTILCDLEKIYPPSFFDVMAHLTVHLPDEALLRGPIVTSLALPCPWTSLVVASCLN